METNTTKQESLTRRSDIPESLLNESFLSIPIPPASVYILSQSKYSKTLNSETLI